MTGPPGDLTPLPRFAAADAVRRIERTGDGSAFRQKQRQNQQGAHNQAVLRAALPGDFFKDLANSGGEFDFRGGFMRHLLLLMNGGLRPQLYHFQYWVENFCEAPLVS